MFVLVVLLLHGHVVGVHKSTSLMSSSLLLQQCPACLVRLTWIVFVIGGRWPYSWCLVGCCCQDLFKIACSNNHYYLFACSHMVSIFLFNSNNFHIVICIYQVHHIGRMWHKVNFQAGFNNFPLSKRVTQPRQKNPVYLISTPWWTENNLIHKFPILFELCEIQ